MYRKIRDSLALTAVVLLLPLVFAGEQAMAGSSQNVDYTSMSAEELAEHLIFEAKGFDIDTETQEGGTVGDRLRQDELQKTCSALKGGQLDSATVQKVTQLARDSMVYPDGGIELGDWKKGQALAENAFGFRVGHKVDDHGERETGALCMNCHQLEQDKAIRSGTLGPSLLGYGEALGMSEQTKKYVYEVIYNPHAIFPCTKMPRFGANGVLTQQKIADIMAYLLDPASPVNK